MASEKKQVSRRNALKIIVGAGILVVAGVVVSTMRFFTGSPETAPTTTSLMAVTAATPATTSTMAAATTAASQVAATNTGVTAWPRLLVTNVKSLQLLTPLVFDYPVVGTGNIIVKLGVKADNGVGPDGDIVAFSRICQHLGCIYSFFPPQNATTLYFGLSTTINNPPSGYCPCHGSVYDFTHNGAVIGGPAPNPVPRVLLEYDQATGDIYVNGMGPPTIYGMGGGGCGPNASLLQCDTGTGKIVTQITLSPQS
jgi:arsenite oxidase small subunit